MKVCRSCYALQLELEALLGPVEGEEEIDYRIAWGDECEACETD